MPQHFALIIGIDAYHHLNPLKKAKTDATDLRNLLVQRGYPESNIAILLDDDATKPEISDKLDWLSRRTPKDSTVLIFFSGHGAQRIGGLTPGEYLCPVEADWYNLESTAISNDQFTRALNAIKAERLVVFLDACHSGGVGNTKNAANVKEGLSQNIFDQLTAGKGRAVIASCHPEEVSYELDGMTNSLFAHYLLEGIQSEAVDLDSAVRVLKLFSYLAQQVPKRQPNQHPLLKTEASDDIVLCQPILSPSISEPVRNSGIPEPILSEEKGVPQKPTRQNWLLLVLIGVMSLILVTICSLNYEQIRSPFIGLVATTSPTATASVTMVPTDTPDVEASVVAGVQTRVEQDLASTAAVVALTLTAQAPTVTPTPTATSTPDIEATVQARITVAAEGTAIAALTQTVIALTLTAEAPTVSPTSTPTSTADVQALVQTALKEKQAEATEVALALTSEAPTVTLTHTPTRTPNVKASVQAAVIVQMNQDATSTAVAALTMTSQAPTATRTPNIRASVQAVAQNMVETGATSTAEASIDMTAKAPTMTATPTATQTPDIEATVEAAIAATVTRYAAMALTSTASVPTATPTATQTPSLFGRIAFSSDPENDNTTSIYLMNADGSNRKELTDNASNDDMPAWSPDGDQIAFISDRDGNDEIYIMSADGSNQRRLTDTTGDEDDPSWSPDGKQIVFSSGGRSSRTISIINIDGSGRKRLTVYGGNHQPDWSPDGEAIVFMSDQNGDPKIFTMNANGAYQTRITDSGYGTHFEPVWSPNGAQIAYCDDFTRISILQLQPRKVIPIPNLPRSSCRSTWSPDGQWLAFESGQEDSEIYVIRLDGTGLRQLTDNSWHDDRPAWSPQ